MPTRSSKPGTCWPPMCRRSSSGWKSFGRWQGEGRTRRWPGNYRSLWLLGPDCALCNSDAPHIISASAGYDLPFGQGHRLGGDATGLLNQLISGWRVNTIFTYSSGPQLPGPNDQRQVQFALKYNF